MEWSLGVERPVCNADFQSFPVGLIVRCGGLGGHASGMHTGSSNVPKPDFLTAKSYKKGAALQRLPSQKACLRKSLRGSDTAAGRHAVIVHNRHRWLATFPAGTGEVVPPWILVIHTTDHPRFRLSRLDGLPYAEKGNLSAFCVSCERALADFPGGVCAAVEDAVDPARVTLNGG